jgi:hypothetical protein
MKLRTTATLLLGGFIAMSLAGCTSNAAQEQQLRREAARKVADDDQALLDKEHSEEAEQSMILKEQDRLDGVVQKQKRDPFAHSCRKVTAASYQLSSYTVDTSQCDPQQLSEEKQFEHSQQMVKMTDDAYGGADKNPFHHD